MTLTNTLIETVSALGNGSNKNFTISFAFQANSQVTVYLQDETAVPYTRTLLVYGAGAGKYTISGGDPGTTVVMGTAPSATQRVVIKRVTTLTQTVDYVETAAFPAEDHEEQMDKNVQMLQEAQGLAAKKIGLAVASTATVPTFPDPEATKFVKYNTAGTDLELSPAVVTGDILKFGAADWEAFALDSALSAINAGIALKADQTALDAHTTDMNDPHNTGAFQVSVVPAGSIASTDVQSALVEIATEAAVATGAVANDLSTHTGRTDNPHTVTAAQVGNGTAQWNADKLLGKALSLSGLADGDVLHYSAGDDEFHPVSSPLGPNPTYDTVGLTTGLADPAYVEGRIFYDDNEKCISYYNDTNGVKVNLGQEEHIRVVNKTGGLLANGDVVYINGAQGQRPTIAKARANTEATSEGTIGMVTADIADNATGYVTTLGLVHDIDTSAWVEGTIVYLSAATDGAITATRPTGTNLAVVIGVVTNQHATNGHVLIAPRFLGTLNPTLTGLTGTVLGTNPRLYTALGNLETKGLASQPIYNGIEDSSTIAVAFNASTQAITVTHTGTTNVWVSGVKYAKTGAENISLTSNTTGRWFLYYDATGTLTVSQTPWDILVSAPLMLIYYRANDNKALLFDERHPASSGMSDYSHKYNHENIGTLLGAGATIADYALTNNANLDYSVSSATLKDEDLEFSLLTLADGGSRKIFWLDAAGGARWNWATANGYGIISSGVLPAGDIYYNNVAAGTQVAQATLGSYVNYWPIALQFYAEVDGATQTPLSPGYAVIMGQASYTSLSAAQAVNPITGLQYVGNLTAEGNIFARITYIKSNPGANIKIAADPVTFRYGVSTLTASSFTPTDHQSLSNRSATGAHPGVAISKNVATTAINLTLDTTVHDYVSVTGTCNITLPTADASNTGRTMIIDNAGTGVTVTIIGTVSGVVNLTLDDNDVLEVISTGSAWRAI